MPQNSQLSITCWHCCIREACDIPCHYACLPILPSKGNGKKYTLIVHSLLSVFWTKILAAVSKWHSLIILASLISFCISVIYKFCTGKTNENLFGT